MDDEVSGLSGSSVGGHTESPETEEDKSLSGLIPSTEADHPEGNEEDIRKWWDIDNNISQKVHAYDPNRLDEMESIEFCNKKYDEHDINGKKAIWIAFSFRHQEADMNDLLGYDVNADAKTWWNTYNPSQHQHMMDPHQMLYGSLELSMKKYDELNYDEKLEVDKIYDKKHSESSSANKHPKSGEARVTGRRYGCYKCSDRFDTPKQRDKHEEEHRIVNEGSAPNDLQHYIFPDGHGIDKDKYSSPEDVISDFGDKCTHGCGRKATRITLTREQSHGMAGSNVHVEPTCGYHANTPPRAGYHGSYPISKLENGRWKSAEALNMEDVGDAEYNHILGLLDDDRVPHVGYDRDEYMEDIWDEISPEERQHFQDPADLDYQKADLEQTGYWELEPEEQDDFFNYAHTMEATAFDDDNPHPGVDHFGWQNRCTLCGKTLFTPEELEKRKSDLKKSKEVEMRCKCGFKTNDEEEYLDHFAKNSTKTEHPEGGSTTSYNGHLPSHPSKAGFASGYRGWRGKESTPNIGAAGWWNSLSREEKAGIVGDPDIYDLKYNDLSDLQMDQVNYTHFRNKIPSPQKYEPKGSPEGDD